MNQYFRINLAPLADLLWGLTDLYNILWFRHSSDYCCLLLWVPTPSPILWSFFLFEIFFFPDYFIFVYPQIFSPGHSWRGLSPPAYPCIAIVFRCPPFTVSFFSLIRSAGQASAGIVQEPAKSPEGRWRQGNHKRIYRSDDTNDEKTQRKPEAQHTWGVREERKEEQGKSVQEWLKKRRW